MQLEGDSLVCIRAAYIAASLTACIDLVYSLMMPSSSPFDGVTCRSRMSTIYDGVWSVLGLPTAISRMHQACAVFHMTVFCKAIVIYAVDPNRDSLETPLVSTSPLLQAMLRDILLDER